jgi:hypothetical protein
MLISVYVFNSQNLFSQFLYYALGVDEVYLMLDDTVAYFAVHSVFHSHATIDVLFYEFILNSI